MAARALSDPPHPCAGTPGPGSRRGRGIEYETSPEHLHLATFFQRPSTGLSIGSGFGSPNARYRGLSASMSQPNMMISYPPYPTTMPYDRLDSRGDDGPQSPLRPQSSFSSFDGSQSARSLRLQTASQTRTLRLKSQSHSRLATLAEKREGIM